MPDALSLKKALWGLVQEDSSNVESGPARSSGDFSHGVPLKNHFGGTELLFRGGCSSGLGADDLENHVFMARR